VFNDDFVEGLYEAAVIPARWESWLSQLAERSGAKAALCCRLHGDNVDIVSTSALFKETWDVIMRDHGGGANERSRRLVQSRRAGFITDADVFAKGEAERLPMYRDLLIPRGFGSGLATSIAVPSGEYIILNLEKSFAEGPFARSVVNALDLIRPDFARAVFLSHRIQMERARSIADALDQLSLPAAALGPSGRILVANARMTALMPHAIQDMPSRMKLSDAAADVLFAAALASLNIREDKTAVRSIPIAAREGNPPIIFHLTPVKGAAHDILTGARAILVATPVVPSTAPGADLVQGLFDLTAAEARLASLIAGGHPPREAAVMLGWTEATARTTLKQVFAKTGVSRQADLVGLLRGGAIR
jgi:DNA-binding CsgD family transcriptional regulator